MEDETSDDWCGLASSAALNRACETLVKKYNLWKELDELYRQYLPEEMERFGSLLSAVKVTTENG